MTLKTRIPCVVAFLLLADCARSPAPSAPAATIPAVATATAQTQHQMMHAPKTTAEWARGAMLFSGLGTFHRAVTTSSAEAQRYFDQGMVLMWGFNHDEATRSFAKAAEIDPDCAACYWGVALTVGPNYNLPFMVAERAGVATEALDLARVHQGNASPEEQALITALVERYPGNAPLDPVALQPVLLAYSEAMRKVAAEFPDDLDVQTLYAESLMNLRAWKLWEPDGRPAPGTLQIVSVAGRG